MPFADLLRVVCVAEAVVLVPQCVYAILGAAMSLDQRLRFVSLGLIGVVVAGGQIDAWGRPGNWRMPLLVLALALAVYGSARFLALRRRASQG